MDKVKISFVKTLNCKMIVMMKIIQIRKERQFQFLNLLKIQINHMKLEINLLIVYLVLLKAFKLKTELYAILQYRIDSMEKVLIKELG